LLVCGSRNGDIYVFVMSRTIDEMEEDDDADDDDDADAKVC